MSSIYLNDCWLDYRTVGDILELQYRSIGSVSGLQHVDDRIVFEKERSQELQTFADSVQEKLTLNPKPLGISELVHFQEQVINVVNNELKDPRVVRIYNQISLRKIAFSQGDSGTCIYAVGPYGKAGCIGMAIASHPDGGCIVTPITAILSACGIL